MNFWQAIKRDRERVEMMKFHSAIACLCVGFGWPPAVIDRKPSGTELAACRMPVKIDSRRFPTLRMN